MTQLLQSEAQDAAPAPKPRRVRKTRWAYAVAIGLAGFAVVFGGIIATYRTLAFVYDPTRSNARDNVIVLSASWCGYCRNLRRHLTDLDIPYTELDVEQTTEGRWAYVAVRGSGIPITIVGKQVIRGTGEEGSRWAEIDGALKTAGYTIPARRDHNR